MSWLSRIVVGLAVLLVLVGAAAATTFMLINPVELVKDRLIAQVKESTGRDLAVRGSTGLSFWPSLAVSLGNVTLSPPPGMRAPPTLQAREVAVRVAIWPLLEGRARVESVALEQPIFDLRRDANGATSWTFAGLTLPARRTRFAQSGTGAANSSAQASAARDQARTLALLEKLELNSIRISNGIVNYTDEPSGHAEAFRNINIGIQGRSLRDRAAIDGRMLVRDATVSFDATLAVPYALLTGAPANLDVRFGGDAVSGTLKGAVDLDGETIFRGPIAMSGPSVRKLARLAAYDAPAGDTLGALKISGNLKVARDRADLTTAKLALGDLTADGRVSGAFDGPRPIIDADLAINAIDGDKLSAGLRDLKRVGLPASSRPAAAGGGAQPNSINDLLRRSQVKGFLSRDGWDATPIDIAMLKLADVRAKVRTGPVTSGTVRLDAARARLALRNGAARLDIDEARLYDGALSGIVTVDPARAGLRFGANLKGDGFAARRLLKDFANVDLVAAATDARIAVGASGASVKDLASGLTGTASLAMRDGAIIGWNVAEMIRQVQRGNFNGLNQSPSQKTDFSSMTASFDIKRGVATNQDLKLVGPLIRVTGNGKIDIGARRLDYLVKPRVVADITGQGAIVTGQGGFEIPVRVVGRWDDPDFQPQLAGLLGGGADVTDAYERGKEQLQDLKRQFKGRKTEEVLDGLLKNDGAGAKQLLDGLLGR
ncbi:MAG: AsmA family protein [Pseudomonadota bacterium]